jgi:hypothetical protein
MNPEVSVTVTPINPTDEPVIQPTIVFNDSSRYATKCEWIQDVEQLPINDYEKNMLKNTKSPEQLLKEEQEEKSLELSEEEQQKQKRRDYITKIKVIGLNMMEKHPLTNPSYFSHVDKQRLINHMENLLKEDDDVIDILFNQVCTEKIFYSNADYSTYPVYKNLV